MTPARPLWLRAIPELLYILGGFGIYSLGRYLAAQHVDSAFAHAAQVWHLERAVHLPGEAVVQQWTIDHWLWLVQLANRYYVDAHFPIIIAVLVWIFWRHPDVYGWVRNSLLAATGASLALHFIYPLAPPRMLTGHGFVDTGAVYGPSAYPAPTTHSVANQYAAMPSLHVAWALAAAIALIAAFRSVWRWLWLLHPAITTVVVVVTANHYWLDAIVGAALMVAAATLCHQLAVRRAPARAPAPVEEAARAGDAY